MSVQNNTCDIIQKLKNKLYESIKNDNMNNIKLCIELGVGKIKLDKNLRSFREKQDIVKLLMENDMLCENIYGSLFVFYATKGNVDFMKVIQKNGKDYIKSDDLSLALVSAAEYNQLDVVIYLASIIVDLPRVMRMHKYDVFIICCINGYVEIAKYLLERCVKADVLNNYPLIISASNGRKDIVELLLNNDVDVHAKNDEALTLAIENNHMEVVKVLLKYGANKDLVKNSDKRITDKEVLALANGEDEDDDLSDLIGEMHDLYEENMALKKKLDNI